MSLWQDFLINDRKVIHKWVQYFPAYEKHFSSWINKSITFIEIGVDNGGSLQMWQRYFGPMAKIVGIDINPQCKVHESPGIFVRIGDQSDHMFLQSIIDEFGIPDIVLDDGSHQMVHIIKSFEYFYPRMHKNAIYMVEDLHTAYWDEFGGGINKPDTFINFSKQCVDRLNADHTRGMLSPDLITRQTFSISFYDSIVCFEKGDVWWKGAYMIGNNISQNNFNLTGNKTPDSDANEMASQLFPGPDYIQWLQHFHNILKPKSYIEIGIESGRALALATAGTRAIGIDPAFKIIHSLMASTHLFRLTSDDFFAKFDPTTVLGFDVIDFSFIDGLHTFDQALKDFIYIEHYAGPQTVVLFHDIYPITKATSTRERTTEFWTGDTWKVIPALRASRPDLKIFTIPTFPSGLGVITNLDPKSTVLVDNFEFILKECFTWDFETIDGTQNEILNVVPNDPVIVSELIGFSEPKK